MMSSSMVGQLISGLNKESLKSYEANQGMKIIGDRCSGARDEVKSE